MTISAQRIVVRIGMSQEIPGMPIGEMGWDIDLHRLRVGDGSSIPAIIMANKSIGPFEFNFIDYVQYPEIRMLPDGTVDGVDISDLNAANGFLVRRGNNLWAHRAMTNTDNTIVIQNPQGLAGDPVFNLSDYVKGLIYNALQYVRVDNITIHGDGTDAAPLYAHVANYNERGVVELADANETIVGVDNSRAITPASLSARTATFDRTGLIRKATLQEVLDGNNTDAAVTPAYLKEYVNKFGGKGGGWLYNNEVAYTGPVLSGGWGPGYWNLTNVEAFFYSFTGGVSEFGSSYYVEGSQGSGGDGSSGGQSSPGYFTLVQGVAYRLTNGNWAFDTGEMFATPSSGGQVQIPLAAIKGFHIERFLSGDRLNVGMAQGAFRIQGLRGYGLKWANGAGPRP